jgi:heptosyltransferase-2
MSEILVIQTAFLGDLLLGIPLFKELKGLYPGARVTVLCRQGLGEFLTKADLVDEVIEADKTSKASWAHARARVLRKHYDLLLCPHESFRSAWLAREVRAKKKIGYPRWFNRFVFDERVRRPLEFPEAIRQLALLMPLSSPWRERVLSYQEAQARAGGQGIARGELATVPSWADMSVSRLVGLRDAYLSNGDLTLASSDRVRDLVKRVGISGRRVTCLAPGSVWRTKQWTSGGFTALARAKLSEGDLVLLIGSPQEKSLCEEIAASAPGAISIAGETSLYESAEVLALADLLVCNDSGAMHMAATARTPTVAVFGPTVLEFGYRPWQNQACVAEVDLKCRPCGRHGADECPIGTHECMKAVKAEVVAELTRRLRS